MTEYKTKRVIAEETIDNDVFVFSECVAVRDNAEYPFYQLHRKQYIMVDGEKCLKHSKWATIPMKCREFLIMALTKAGEQ